MSYPYQLAVIGSGAGGKDAAILGARAGLRVLLVETESLGGTSFHRGCHAMRALPQRSLFHLQFKREQLALTRSLSAPSRI